MAKFKQNATERAVYRTLGLVSSISTVLGAIIVILTLIMCLVSLSSNVGIVYNNGPVLFATVIYLIIGGTFVGFGQRLKGIQSDMVQKTKHDV